MDNYEVIWSRESVYDVADIADYIELDPLVVEFFYLFLIVLPKIEC